MGHQRKHSQVLNSGHSDSHKVGLEPQNNGARNAIKRLKSVEENNVIDIIESR